MNRSIIIEHLKSIEKEVCDRCPAKDYNDCKTCKIDYYINAILNELNGT